MEQHGPIYRNSAKDEVLEVARREARRTLEDSVKEKINFTSSVLDAVKTLGFESSVIDVHGDSHEEKIGKSDKLNLFTRKRDGGLDILTFQEIDGYKENPHLYRSPQVMDSQDWYNTFSTRIWQKKNMKKVAGGAYLSAIGTIFALQYVTSGEDIGLLEFGTTMAVAFLGAFTSAALAGSAYVSKCYPLRGQEVAKGSDALLYIANEPVESILSNQSRHPLKQVVLDAPLQESSIVEPTKLQRVWDYMNTPIKNPFRSKVCVEMDEAEDEEVEVAEDKQKLIRKAKRI